MPCCCINYCFSYFLSLPLSGIESMYILKVSTHALCFGIYTLISEFKFCCIFSESFCKETINCFSFFSFREMFSYILGKKGQVLLQKYH